MFWRKLAADNECPQLKRQTRTPGSPPCFLREVCGFFWSPSTKRSRDWTDGLTSLSEKTRRSNHLQMWEQWQHLFLIYFKTLSVGPARNRARASCTLDWHLTNWANQAAVFNYLFDLIYYNYGNQFFNRKYPCSLLVYCC